MRASLIEARLVRASFVSSLCSRVSAFRNVMILQQRLYPSSGGPCVSNLSISRHKRRAPVISGDGGALFQAGGLRVVCELRMSLTGENRVRIQMVSVAFGGRSVVLDTERARKNSDVPVLPEIGSSLFRMLNAKQRRRIGRLCEGRGHEPSIHGLNDIFTSDAFGLAVSAGRVS
jgi:hypothetical protein